MKFAQLQRQWFLLNTLIFLPWISCQRLDTFGETNDNRPSPSVEASRSSAFRDSLYRVPRRALPPYPIDDGGDDPEEPEIGYPATAPAARQRATHTVNRDFYFDYSRDERDNDHRPVTTNQKGNNNAALVQQRPPSGSGRAASAVEFSYKEKDKFGPSNWHKINPRCGGKFQSPIMLNTSSALFVRNKRPLQLVGQTNLPQAMRLQNDGHSAKFSYLWSQGDRPYLRGGPLKSKYYFEQFHFHWGSNSTSGSEHVLDYQRYPMELHMIFYNALYSSFEEAREEVDGLVVVALFYEMYTVNDEPLNTWTRFLKEVTNPDDEFIIQFIDTFPLYDLIGDVEWPYFSYEGSLTTPPCLETVIWIVSTKPLPITPKEMREFRQLKSKSGPMVNNYRPVQKLYNRRVYRY